MMPAAEWLRYVPASVRGLVIPHLPASMRGDGDEPDPAPSRGGRFLSASFSNAAGTRPYRLFVPASYHGQPVPLIVMLHGCTQSPEDFAIGTGMNEAAAAACCLVVYPGQITGAHAQKCWKWFNAADQHRDRGEPSLIAGITRQVMAEYAVDPRRVFVAGMSAGGAAAAVMGEAYPDLYAAIGVHSGLACGVAHDVPSALAAMKTGGTPAAGGRRTRIVPTIVFHGDQDNVVSPRNAEVVVGQSVRGIACKTERLRGQSAGGRSYSRTIYSDPAGQVVTEQWVVHGSGHAWSGGQAPGSYTDPLGPDATGEMLRFFFEHPTPA